MKQSQKKSRFVVFGPQMIRESRDFKAKKLEIRKRISESYKEDFIKAHWWRKLFLKIKMEKEIQKELDLLIPPHELYFSADKKA